MYDFNFELIQYLFLSTAATTGTTIRLKFKSDLAAVTGTTRETLKDDSEAFEKSVLLGVMCSRRLC